MSGRASCCGRCGDPATMALCKEAVSLIRYDYTIARKDEQILTLLRLLCTLVAIPTKCDADIGESKQLLNHSATLFYKGSRRFLGVLSTPRLGF